MKYIITENQYSNYKKSIISKILRRVGHRIDEIVEATVKDNLYSVSKNMSSDKFADRIIMDVWDYVYESYIAPDIEFGGEEHHIFIEFLSDRYTNLIKEMYNSSINQDNKYD
jgi:hypothetical protein